jgi:hypothetical protein
MSDAVKRVERAPAIINRTVVSRPGATIKLVRLTMSPSLRAAIERSFDEGRRRAARRSWFRG